MGSRRIHTLLFLPLSLAPHGPISYAAQLEWDSNSSGAANGNEGKGGVADDRGGRMGDLMGEWGKWDSYLIWGREKSQLLLPWHCLPTLAGGREEVGVGMLPPL